MKEKLCPRCFQIKPLEDFYRNANGSFGRSHCCKPCTMVVKREGREEARHLAETARHHNRSIPAIVSNAANWSGIGICDQKIVPQMIYVAEQIDRMRGRE